MIADVSVDGEFFDESFFAYREDADVAWRAQLLGWDALYVPEAVGQHVRRVVPERRGALPAEINRASVRNRFLMRVKNADVAVWRRCGIRGVGRDLAVVAGCLLWEWSSLPGLAEAVRLGPRALRARRLIHSRRRRAGTEIAKSRFKAQGTNVMPDAGFTLRLSYGAVKGYDVKGKHINWSTNMLNGFPVQSIP